MRPVLFALHCLDGDDAAERRAKLGAEHSARLRTASPRPLVCGPLLSDDGERGLGSLFIIDVADRDAAERWIEADPFRSGGVWREVRIHAFRQSANASVQFPTSP
ncbi:YciI family protein [Glycomyces arizonensis]|uniref:YciI family protein n=1 Tax=Glycomyces arizonensis TaxID=256035 RepID=UPI00041FA05C|nr:YciI family protein [Glycomyces arizonensis]